MGMGKGENTTQTNKRIAEEALEKGKRVTGWIGRDRFEGVVTDFVHDEEKIIVKREDGVTSYVVLSSPRVRLDEPPLLN